MVAVTIQSKVDRVTYPKRADISAAPATPIILRNTMRGVKMRKTREHSTNWRGGRTKSSYGYILIWVGVNHPLAYSTGYACEHRVVAAQKIRRILKTTEIVHHKNGDKTDNRPENIEILTSNRQHLFKHRKKGSNLIKPNEKNARIKCACGCGGGRMKYDNSGRPRRYIHGHNSRK